MKEIKDALKSKKLVIGTRVVMKGLKKGSLETVLFASNCPENIRKDLNHYADISKIKVNEFKGDSLKLGEICGKPFTILMVGVKK